MAKEYKKLNKFEEYDKEAAAELAEALNEMVELNNRLSQLKDLVNDNHELRPFVWTTADHKAIALQDIEDDHFKNILTHIVSVGKEIPKAIKAEARRRQFDLPTEVPAHLRLARGGRYIEDDNNIPF